MKRLSENQRFLVVFALLSLSMGVSVGVAKIATALYALHLGAGPAQLGLITSGGLVGLLVMSLPIGFLVDRWGPRRLFVIGSVLGGCTYALVPLVPSPWFLLGATTAVGFFMPLRFVALNTVFFAQIRRMGEGKAGWSRATHMSGMFLIGPGLGALLVSHAGFAATWWLVAASFALTIAVSPLVMRAPVPPPAPPSGSVAGSRTGLAALLRDPDLREANTIDFVSQAASQYTTTFVIVIALNRFGLEPAQASGLVTAWGGTFIGTLLFGGLVARVLPPLRCVQLGFMMVACSLLLLGSAGHAALLWAGMLLQGTGAGLVQSVNLGRIAQAGARHGQGKVSGLNLLIGPLGGLAGSVAGGLLGQHHGLQTVFFCFVPLYGMLAWWQTRRVHGEHRQALA
ncbi:MFS transporter [Roseateles sp.]|uniref:MFS transporter n=1 Tax=Roseateles sp. TaxID=1971397 RepID=UPI0039E82E66